MAPPTGALGGLFRSLVPERLLCSRALLHPPGVFRTPGPLYQLPLCPSSPYTFRADAGDRASPWTFHGRGQWSLCRFQHRTPKPLTASPPGFCHRRPDPASATPQSPEDTDALATALSPLPLVVCPPPRPGCLALVASFFPFLCSEFFFWSLVCWFSGAGRPVMNSVRLFPANILVLSPLQRACSLGVEFSAGSFSQPWGGHVQYFQTRVFLFFLKIL